MQHRFGQILLMAELSKVTEYNKIITKRTLTGPFFTNKLSIKLS
jgi:hypothetical protein